MRSTTTTILLPFLLLLLFSAHAESAVLSIDIGSEWLKVAVVNVKPGQAPISVAINEMSKRKSPSLVAFSSGERLVGEEAAAISARHPHKVYSLVRDMIGKPYPYAKETLDSLYLPFDLVEDERGAVAVRVDGGGVYTVEELVAMVMKYAVGLGEAHVKGQVRDAVVTVPAWFGQAERKGLMQAAVLAGVNVLALVNGHAGAALQYGIDKDFSNESRHVVFYDMGAGSTYAALVYYSAYNAKEFGKSVSVNQFQVKDVRWKTKLGGQQMEMRLVEYFADEFNKQVGNGIDMRKSPKAMAKLKKQVKRTKEILSANTAAPLSVESLYDDRDFRGTITREKFEELCGDLWDRALDPLRDVLKHSGLKLDEVYAVELIGGATRVPKLQAKLQEFLGRKDLDKHLDADEAVVLGAALHAANISDGIKLNRKLGMIDGSPYGFMVELDGLDLIELEGMEPLLVPRMKKLPTKFLRSIKHGKDFGISLSYESANPLPSGVSVNKFAQFAVLGLTEASEKHSTRNLSSPIKANLHFSLSRSGIISFDRAEAVIEYFEWVEIPKKNLTVENSTLAANISAKANNKNGSEEIKGSSNLVNETDNSLNQNLEGEIIPEVSTEKKLKKKTFRVPLKIVDKTVGPGVVLSKKSLSEAKVRLESLDKKDEERRRTAESKNNLEGYIYATREKLEDSADIHKVLAEPERKYFTEKLHEVQEWLYTDGEDASAKEIQVHLNSLKSLGDPIFLRLNELSALPVACEHAKNYLSGIQKIVTDWEKNKSWLPKARIDKVLSEADKVKKWLEEKEALQNKTSPFSTPIFTSEEVHEKILELQDEVAIVNRIPKPKPKIEKPSKGETRNGTKSREESTGSSDTTDDGASDEPKQEKPTSSISETDPEAEIHDEL